MVDHVHQFHLVAVVEVRGSHATHASSAQKATAKTRHFTPAERLGKVWVDAGASAMAVSQRHRGGVSLVLGQCTKHVMLSGAWHRKLFHRLHIVTHSHEILRQLALSPHTLDLLRRRRLIARERFAHSRTPRIDGASAGVIGGFGGRRLVLRVGVVLLLLLLGRPKAVLGGKARDATGLLLVADVRFKTRGIGALPLHTNCW